MKDQVNPGGGACAVDTSGKKGIIRRLLDMAYRIVPRYALLPIIVCLSFNSCVYYGARIINAGRIHHDITTAFEEALPVVPEWTIIYFGCYIFWIVNYVWISRISRKHCYQFLFADLMGKLVCLIVFVLYPTTNVRPDVLGSGVFDALLRLLYQIDAADNLLPSIHCLVSWYCFAGIRGRKEIPRGYQIFSFMLVILICISTLLTKQHVLIDVIAGIGLAEITWQISLRTRGYRLYERARAFVLKKL